MDSQQLRNILESCLLVTGKAMSLPQLEVLFEEDIDRPERTEIKEALLALQVSYEGRGIELVEVASGWRLQSAASMEHWVGRLFQEKQPRYSRALLETLVLIAYRQPITRGEIEDVRGVAVSSNIIRTLQEREWIKEMGFKDVPGKPALWGTTKAFLDYFNLSRLDELPTLAEARDLAEIDAALAAEVGLVDGMTDSVAANDSQGEENEQNEQNDAASSGESADELAAAHDNVAPMEPEVSEVTPASSDSSGVDENVDRDENESDLSDRDTIADSSIMETGAGAGAEVSGSENDVVSPPVEIKSGGEDDLSDVDVSVAEDADDSADLISLAGILGKERQPGVEPDLSALVDGFGSDHETKANGEHLSPESDDKQLAAASDVITEPPTESDASCNLPDSQVNNSALAHVSDEPPASVPGNLPPIEAVEISAHDLDIDEWKEPEPKRRNQGSDGGGGDDRAQAESDLRRVIDDFAEDHRNQIDADNRLNSRLATTPETNSNSSSDGAQEQANEVPVTVGDGISEGLQQRKLYGIRGTVDSELDPDGKVDTDDKTVDGQHGNTQGGEP